MKLVIIVGSLRKDSYNLKVAQEIKKRNNTDHDIEIIRLNDLPLFNEDIEKNPPVEVSSFKDKIKEAEGVIIVTPEYNHSIPGGLKNALDWCSRVDRVLADKPVMILGASTGNVGTARCQTQIRQVLNAPGIAAMVLPGNYILIPNVQDLFDKGNNFIDTSSLEYIDKIMDKFVRWFNLLNSRE
ncbi:MAG: NADPH-dependent FMN reductase [Gudongella sp.]|nr:NADPH-dependent FMN reductase [Gudongella sp.]